MTEDRFGKVKEMVDRMNPLCSAFYETLSEASKPEFWEKVDAFALALERYLKIEVVWDSKLIDVVGSAGGRKFKTKAFSCTDSVMDTARALYVFMQVPCEQV